MSRYDIPVQKGAINPAIKTMKTENHLEKQVDQSSMNKELRDGQILKMHKPK